MDPAEIRFIWEAEGSNGMLLKEPRHEMCSGILKSQIVVVPKGICSCFLNKTEGELWHRCTRFYLFRSTKKSLMTSTSNSYYNFPADTVKKLGDPNPQWKTGRVFHCRWVVIVKSGFKVVCMESNSPCNATHWLATRWSGLAALWSDPKSLWQVQFKPPICNRITTLAAASAPCARGRKKLFYF